MAKFVSFEIHPCFSWWTFQSLGLGLHWWYGFLVVQSNVNALVDAKLEKFKNLREEARFYWGEISEGTLKFDRRESEVWCQIIMLSFSYNVPGMICVIFCILYWIIKIHNQPFTKGDIINRTSRNQERKIRKRKILWRKL